MHSSTIKSPFEVIEVNPRPPLMLKMKHNIFAIDEYVRDIQESFKMIKEAIFALQHKQKRAVDKHRRPLEFNINDWVLPKFTKSWLRHTTCKDFQGQPIG